MGRQLGLARFGRTAALVVIATLLAWNAVRGNEARPSVERPPAIVQPTRAARAEFHSASLAGPQFTAFCAK